MPEITPAAPEREILTTAQAADLLQLTPNYLMALARRGRVPAHRLTTKQWRFLRSELMAWIAAQDANPAPRAHDVPAQEEPPRG